MLVDADFTMFWSQPEDWDDKEYIPDPEDKKPEVNKLFILYANHIFKYSCGCYNFGHVSYSCRVMMTFPRKLQILMPRR